MSDFIRSTADMMLDVFGSQAAREAMNRAQSAEDRRDERAADNWHRVLLAVQNRDETA